jgi:hypothetical protein
MPYGQQRPSGRKSDPEQTDRVQRCADHWRRWIVAVFDHGFEEFLRTDWTIGRTNRQPRQIENERISTMVRRLMIFWLILLAAGYAVATAHMAGTLRASKAEAAAEHRARLDPSADETGRTSFDRAALERANGDQNKVMAGIYVDRIPRLSMPDTNWVVDFYLWFNWSNPDIAPGRNFDVIDGEILSKELKARVIEGRDHYELYRVQASITKFFNVSRFPLDDHLLTLRIEDAEHQIDALLYVADTEGSAISSRVKIPGYDIYETTIVQKPHSYKTRRGDPRLEAGFMATYSQLVYGIAIREPGMALYVKMFLGTFASVAICLLSFLVGPTQIGSRFSIGIGSFFAAVASTYVVSRLIPRTGTVGLTDYVMAASLVTIFLAVLTSTMTVKLAETEGGDIDFLRRFDIAALLVFLVGFVTLNTVIGHAAQL